MQISQKLEYWKSRLLDLSKGNRLINCALPKPGGRISRTSLVIYNPAPEELWNAFADAENDSPIKFAIPTEDANDLEDIDDVGQVTWLAKSKFDVDVTTNQSPTETMKTLRVLMKKAKEFTEEKGLNALYLAVGFLTWHENGTDGQEFRSPLLLVPVSLTQNGLNDPFVLSRFDEEIITNDALEQKLRSDFGVVLPHLEESDDINSYLSKVQAACSAWKWTIESDASQLALFSFLKMNMYHDLVRNTGKISEHAIIRALNGEPPGYDETYSDIDGFNHDLVEPQENFSVLDADASQQDAILLAKRGVSFVLQGPPGTGKSQTITNIIAELIADGKKVLFVSEKMAALEVVYKRLKQNCLGDFCLTLHSHNAKRREVLDQLNSSLQLASQGAKLQEDAYSKLLELKSAREILNQYSAELHTTVLPLKRTMFQVNGILAKYSMYRDVDYIIPMANTFTLERLMQCEGALEELSRIIRKSGYQQSNPWVGCSLTALTHEFRQRFTTDSARLLALVEKGLSLFTKLDSLLDAGGPVCRISKIPRLLQLCNLAVRSPKVPSEWLNTNLSENISHLDVCQEAILRRNSIADDIDAKTKAIAQDYAISGQFSSSAEIQQTLQGAINGILQEYDQGILQVHATDMFKRYQLEYRSGFRFINSAYQKDRKTLLGFCKVPSRMNYRDGITLLGKLNDISILRQLFSKRLEVESLHTELASIQAKYECEHEILASLLSLRKDEGLDFTALREQLVWAREFYEAATHMNVGDSFVAAVCNAEEALQRDLKTCAAEVAEWFPLIHKQENEFCSLFDRKSEDWLDNLPLMDIQRIVASCANDLTALETWIDYKEAQKRLMALQIHDFLARAEALSLTADEILPVFQKCFYRSWLDAVMPKYPAVYSFRGTRHSDNIERFKELDRQHMDIAKAMLYARLIRRLPNINSAAHSGGEVALLRQEMAKQRKLMPIRKLIAAIPNLLPALKPCVLMSPLSVSTYLGNSSYVFDTVIFDEASQVRTEDAVGAIFRARQTIIAGDSKQLPPTNFFGSSVSDADDSAEDEDGEIDDTGAYESLLDEATILPTHPLLWHYRSKHEHLIAFSNAKIYGGKLITFPSSVEQADGVGVEYVHVPGGIYERGGKNGNRCEAEKVADLVLDHLQNYPKRSLGIIAFGEVQQTAIEDAIIRKRREHPEYEDFFCGQSVEPLFIKNLETVQGDERDTILFSIGYAPDAAGKFIMNFGPLNREGGERRLNVAITRARYNLKLVGSILPTDIDTERTSGQGPKLLRLYIDFAINGARAILGETSNDDGGFDSPFEEAVFNFLREAGYDVATQVGCSGYRIDLAVRHPKYNGRYAIGIECDGAAYHSARTARERDRLRQTVLEDMGWTIYRVWSTDWIKDQHTEGAKLRRAIEDAIDSYRETIPAHRSEPTTEMDNFLEVDQKSTSEIMQEEAALVRSKYAGLNADKVPLPDFEHTMLCVIENSYGLSKDELFKKTALHGYGWQRQGRVITGKFEGAYQQLLRKKHIAEEDGKIKLLVTQSS